MRSPEIVALIDCHCYYVSCHRLFTPRLQGRPVCVLSNNDSAVVSRSDEAKQLGVKMSQPAYELRELERRHGLVLLSSNYPLYQDCHRRVMASIRSMVAAIDVRSIDEAFALLTGMPGDLTELGVRIQRHVLKTVGIPCGVGISRNRTTAKLANWASKKWKRQTGSVVSITEYERLRKLMAVAEVSEVWGIGPRLTEHLNSYGITTALQLADSSPKHMRRLHGVGLERTIRELNWEYCLGSEDSGVPRQTMSCTRTFPEPLSAYNQIASYVATFAATIGRKLRKERILAVAIKVFIEAARSSIMTPRGKSDTIELSLPTNDSRVLIESALGGLRQCHTAGGSWIRAGVVVIQAIPETNYIPDLFSPPLDRRRLALMQTLDQINRKAGEGTIRFAVEHRNLSQLLRRNYPSQRFTTSWTELPEAY